MRKNPERIYEMIQDEVENKGIPVSRAGKDGGRCNPGAFYAWRSRKAKEKGGQRFVLQKLERYEAERENIKPLMIGRKAWLFSNTKKGAEVTCGMYTIMETALHNGLNPEDYFLHLPK